MREPDETIERPFVVEKGGDEGEGVLGTLYIPPGKRWLPCRCRGGGMGTCGIDKLNFVVDGLLKQLLQEWRLGLHHCGCLLVAVEAEEPHFCHLKG